jgi:hypothetical protein
MQRAMLAVTVPSPRTLPTQLAATAKRSATSQRTVLNPEISQRSSAETVVRWDILWSVARHQKLRLKETAVLEMEGLVLLLVARLRQVVGVMMAVLQSERSLLVAGSLSTQTGNVILKYLPLGMKMRADDFPVCTIVSWLISHVF